VNIAIVRISRIWRLPYTAMESSVGKILNVRKPTISRLSHQFLHCTHCAELFANSLRILEPQSAVEHCIWVCQLFQLLVQPLLILLRV